MSPPPVPFSLSSLDAPWLAALHGACMDEGKGWSEGLLATTLSNPHNCGWAVKAGENPAAFILLSAVAPDAEILTLATHPTCQRQGLARILLRHATSVLAGKNIQKIFLEVAEINGPARALYTACGFQLRGRRAGYYSTPHGPIDALIFCQELVRQEAEG